MICRNLDPSHLYYSSCYSVFLIPIHTIRVQSKEYCSTLWKLRKNAHSPWYCFYLSITFGLSKFERKGIIRIGTEYVFDGRTRGYASFRKAERASQRIRRQIFGSAASFNWYC